MAQTGERFRMLLRVEATEKVTVARISVSTWSFGIRITGPSCSGQGRSSWRTEVPKLT